MKMKAMGVAWNGPVTIIASFGRYLKSKYKTDLIIIIVKRD